MGSGLSFDFIFRPMHMISPTKTLDCFVAEFTLKEVNVLLAMTKYDVIASPVYPENFRGKLVEGAAIFSSPLLASFFE